MIPNLTFLLLFALLIAKHVTTSIDYEEIQIEDQYETRLVSEPCSRPEQYLFRSRILMVDGNVWLHAGKDKNITFKTFGKGKIYVEDTDVSSLPDTVGYCATMDSSSSCSGYIQHFGRTNGQCQSDVGCTEEQAGHADFCDEGRSWISETLSHRGLIV